jgi:hypothetical protein
VLDDRFSGSTREEPSKTIIKPYFALRAAAYTGDISWCRAFTICKLRDAVAVCLIIIIADSVGSSYPHVPGLIFLKTSYETGGKSK